MEFHSIRFQCAIQRRLAKVDKNRVERGKDNDKLKITFDVFHFIGLLRDNILFDVNFIDLIVLLSQLMFCSCKRTANYASLAIICLSLSLGSFNYKEFNCQVGQ